MGPLFTAIFTRANRIIRASRTSPRFRLSIDAVIGAYNKIRYQQMAVGGDVVLTGKSLKITARWRTNQDSEYADKMDAESADVQPMIQSLAGQFLERVNPELAGRAYLQEQRYDRAAGVFTTWANHSTGDWLPYYYLALAISFKDNQQPDKEREAELALLTDWMRGQFNSNKCTAAPLFREKWWLHKEAVWWRLRAMPVFTWPMRETKEDLADNLDDLKLLRNSESATTAEEGFKKLARSHPRDTNYLIGAGTAAENLQNYEEEMELFQAAHAIDPSNAGVERDLGTAFIDLSTARTPTERPELACMGLQYEVRALHLSPGLIDAIGDGVDALDLLQDRDGAVKFTWITSLLNPTSSAARKERVEALVYDNRISDAIEAAAAAPDGKDVIVAVMGDVASDKAAKSEAMELAKESLARWPVDPEISREAKLAAR
jgi:tetratricopeptide (TPR) repeat protein